MAVTYQSSNNSSWSGGTTAVVTKPSGLAVGDLMVATITVQVGYTSYSLPSGFIDLGIFNETPGSQVTTFFSYKIADSGDVAATNFTFNTGASANKIASIVRITGGDTDPSNWDTNAGTLSNTQNPSINASITPDANTLLLQYWISDTSTTNTSNYAIATDNPTWNEVFDDSTGSRAASLAYANRVQSTATGASSCNGGNATTDWGVTLISIPAAPVVAAANNAMFMGANM